MPDDRIEALRREVEENPASRQFYQLGELLRREGEVSEAIGVLRRGLDAQPRYVAAWVALGRACLDGDEPHEAVEALLQAIELDRANPVAWRLLGEARIAGGDRFGALSAFRHALALVPGDDVLAGAVEDLEEELEGAGRHTPPGREGAPEADLGATARIPVSPLAAAKSAGGGAPPPFAAPAAATPAPAPAARNTVAAPAEEPFGSVSAPAVEDAGLADVFGPPAGVEGAAEAAEESPFGAGPTATAEAEADAPFGAAAAAAEIGAPEVEAPAPEVPTIEVEAPAFGAAPAEAPAGDERPAAAEVEQEPAAPGLTGPATVTMARLFIQQQELGAAAATLERVLAARPDNQEACDLLDLVRDMLEPLPEQLPPLSVRERKIAALQRWLASLTLGHGRTVQ